MKRSQFSFRLLLTMLNLGLVLFIFATLLPAAFSILRLLAEENAQRRVELAALSAATEIGYLEANAKASAHLLAERPSLRRILKYQTQDSANLFLEQFRSSDNLDACAVFRNGQTFALAPKAPFWAELELKEGLVLIPDPSDEALSLPILVTTFPIGVSSMDQAVVVKYLNEETIRRLSDSSGVQIRFTYGHGTDLTDGRSYNAIKKLEGLQADFYVVASLPHREVREALQPVIRRFVLAAISAGLLSLGFALLAGKRFARPIQALQRAAGRIAFGDLDSPVERVSGKEMNGLAHAMETMRRRLRQTTRELFQREMEAKTLLAGIVEGVFAVDEERRIRYLNPQMADLLNTTPELAIGQFCGDLLRPESRAGRRPCENDCPIIHARSRGSSRAVEFLTLDKGRLTVVITSAPQLGSRQVQIVRDETEVETARRQRDAILANVSHELKTPLAGQLASIEMLLAGQDSVADIHDAELLASLQRSTLRLNRLIDNLLESVRIETGKTAQRHTSVVLEAVIEEAVAMIEPLLVTRRQRVEIHLPHALPSVDGDAGQLTQVLVNLLANSHKFGPEDSRILIGGEAVNDEVLLWVEDSGPGIPASHSQSIFDQFFRAAEGVEGIGLGLWIVKSIIERHGGRIETSASPSGGARFIVRLQKGRFS